MPENGWDNNIQAASLIKETVCGENRFVGIVNILEFYLAPGCNITIAPVDSIRTNLRLNWTLDQFYSSGGTTKFQDRIAASLGIKVANVKIVSVYQGSVVVDFSLVEDETGTVAKSGGIDSVSTTLTKVLTKNLVNLGAPVLSVSITKMTAAQSAATV